MAGLLRRAATKLLLPSIHVNLARLLPPSFLSVRSMASSKLFVGGLSFNTDEDILKNAFAAHGEVLEAKIIIDRNTGMSRGFGFVTFGSESDAEVALKGMDGKVVNGRLIRVDYATVKPMGTGFASRPNDGFSPGGSRFSQDFGDDGGTPFQDSSRSFTPDMGSQIDTGASDGTGSNRYPRSGYTPSEDINGPSGVATPGASAPSDLSGPTYPTSSVPSSQGANVNSPSPLDDMDLSYPKSSPSYSSGPIDRSYSNDMRRPYPRKRPPYPSSSTFETNSSESSPKSTFGFANDYVLVGTPVPGGPVNVRSERGLSKEIGPYYPNGGYSYSFESSDQNTTPNNSDSSQTSSRASDSAVAHEYAQGGI